MVSGGVVNDIHVHIGHQDMINQSYTARDIINHKRFFGVHKMLIFSTNSQVTTNNITVKSLAKDEKDIYGLYWIGSPDITRVVLSDKMIGVKYHGAYLNRPIQPSPLYEALEKHNAIVMVHCGRYKEGDLVSNTSYQHVIRMAIYYPNLKFIMAHMGGTDTTVCKKAILFSVEHKNIYFDTSGITTPYIIEYAIEHLGSGTDRILFGSDAPWCSFNAQYYNVVDAHICEEDKMNIMYYNFNKLIVNADNK